MRKGQQVRLLARPVPESGVEDGPRLSARVSGGGDNIYGRQVREAREERGRLQLWLRGPGAASVERSTEGVDSRRDIRGR